MKAPSVDFHSPEIVVFPLIQGIVPTAQSMVHPTAKTNLKLVQPV